MKGEIKMGSLMFCRCLRLYFHRGNTTQALSARFELFHPGLLLVLGRNFFHSQGVLVEILYSDRVSFGKFSGTQKMLVQEHIV